MPRERMNLIRIVLCMALAGLCVVTAGCWDRRELQERNFVLAVGIDTAEEGAKAQKNPEVVQNEMFTQPVGDKRYMLSLQILRLAPAGGDEGGKKGASRTFVLSNVGQSFFEMVRDMGGQTGKQLWFEHIQTIIISEAVAKREGIRPTLDFFQRDGEMRSRIKVLITPETARKILEYQPPSGEPGGIFLNNVTRNHVKSIHLGTARTDIGFITQSLDNRGDIMIPQVTLTDDVIKIAGIGQFKGDKLIRILDDYAVMGTRIIRGTEKSAVIPVKLPEDPEGIVVFEVFHHDTHLTPHVEGENIYFTLDINMEGNLGEYQSHLSGYDYDLHNAEFVRRLELLFAEEVKKSALYALKVHQEMGTDNLYFNTKLKAYKPDVWKKVKNRWAEIFPTVPLEVSVNVTIQKLGEHR